MKALAPLNTILLVALTAIVSYDVFRTPAPILVQAPVAVRVQPTNTPIQYTVESIPDQEWDTKAKELGAAGWDIVSCRRASDSDNKFSYECIMKRQALE